MRDHRETRGLTSRRQSRLPVIRCLQGYLSQVRDPADVEMHSAAKWALDAQVYAANDHHHNFLLEKKRPATILACAGMMWECRTLAQPPFYCGSLKTRLQCATLVKPGRAVLNVRAAACSFLPEIVGRVFATGTTMRTVTGPAPTAAVRAYCGDLPWTPATHLAVGFWAKSERRTACFTTASRTDTGSAIILTRRAASNWRSDCT